MTDPSPKAAGETRRLATRGDLISGGLSVAFGLFVVIYVQTFPQLPGGAPGPALFPGIIGALFILFGLVLVIRYLRDRPASAAEKAAAAEAERAAAAEAEQYESLLDEKIPARTAWLNALSVIGSIVFYLLVVNVLGFVITMGLMLIGLMWRLGARMVVAVPSAVVTTAFLYLMFERILLVPLPHGFLG